MNTVPCKIGDKINFLDFGAAKYGAYVQKSMDHTYKTQLLDAELWKKFVDLFRRDDDTTLNKGGWRIEFWGKMMRGGAMCCMYTQDDELYRALEDTVRDLLTTQDEHGRFTTYALDKELQSWDMWGRKYVITGCLHFLQICRDEAFGKTVLEAVMRHADYITDRVGDGEGKLSISDTSRDGVDMAAKRIWGGLNSASILDAFVELYVLTGKENYKEFADHIINFGGTIDNNLIDLAVADELAPYQYPVTKAYEMMSFFEGVLAYYKLTGEEKYLTCVENFAKKVMKTDITVIGCSGCTHELFDHSYKMQTEYSEIIMQETCVTVTWERLMARLLALTGDPVYADQIEIAYLNAMLGSINTKNEKGFHIYTDEVLDPLPFDSYSPLYNNRRGKSVGGFKRFADTFYSCCVCIAPAGLAVYPLTAVMSGEDGPVVNNYVAGSVNMKTPKGNRLTLESKTGYPYSQDYNLTLCLDESEVFEIAFRVPAWCDGAKVVVNGTQFTAERGYVRVKRRWFDGDSLDVLLPMPVKMHKLNGKIAFTRGPITLARDSAKEGADAMSAPVKPAYPLNFKLADPVGDELVRGYLALENGETLLLTDYQSCGKEWNSGLANITCWMNEG